jgi:inner membrane protein
MDNLTHTLFSIALARAGGARLGPYATGIAVLAANAPDIDILSRIGSTANFLDWHRGPTHSLVAAPLLAAAVAGLFVLVDRLSPAANRKSQVASRKPQAASQFSFLRAWLVALGFVLFAHVFLDWSTSYGTQLLWPFSQRWLAWDAIPIIDLWLLVVLASALTLRYLFRMISEEVGAQRGSGRGAAIFAVAFLLAWFGFRGVLHARAAAMLDAHVYNGLEPQRVGAFADMGNPFRWHGVVQTAETLDLADLNPLGEFEGTPARTYYPPAPSPALEVARQTRVGRIFLAFARFPWAYVQPTEDGYLVVMRDLRFEQTPRGRKGFVAEFRLTPSLTVVSQVFYFQPPEPVR